MSSKQVTKLSSKQVNQIKKEYPSYSFEQMVKDIKLISKDHPGYNSEQIKNELSDRYKNILRQTKTAYQQPKRRPMELSIGLNGDNLSVGITSNKKLVHSVNNSFQPKLEEPKVQVQEQDQDQSDNDTEEYNGSMFWCDEEDKYYGMDDEEIKVFDSGYASFRREVLSKK